MRPCPAIQSNGRPSEAPAGAACQNILEAVEDRLPSGRVSGSYPARFPENGGEEPEPRWRAGNNRHEDYGPQNALDLRPIRDHERSRPDRRRAEAAIVDDGDNRGDTRDPGRRRIKTAIAKSVRQKNLMVA